MPAQTGQNARSTKEKETESFHFFNLIIETCSAVLTFESADEILWYDHLNETSLAVILHGTIRFFILYEIKFGIFLEF